MLMKSPLRDAMGMPPKNGSQSYQRDLIILNWLQKTRTLAGIKNAWSYLDKSIALFEPAIGSSFSKKGEEKKKECLHL